MRFFKLESPYLIGYITSCIVRKTGNGEKAFSAKETKIQIKSTQ